MSSTKKTTASAKKTAHAKTPPRAAPVGDPLGVVPAEIVMAPSALVGFTPNPVPYAEAAAKKALAELRPLLAVITPDRLVTPRVDVDAVARAMLATHAFVTQAPGVYGWYTRLAKARLFDITNVDDLHRVASVVLFTYREADAAGAFKTNAKVPAKLDEDSARVEREMQAVCEHNLSDHPVHGPMLARLRPGTSYLDRADDLLGYARIYEAERALLSKDTKYKKTHVADARKYAGEILAALGAAMSPKAREPYDLLVRAWTLLSKMAVEVRAAGLYLLRYDPQREQRFPSIYVIGRPGVGVRKGAKQDAEAAAEPDGEAEAAPAEGEAEDAPAKADGEAADDGDGAAADAEEKGTVGATPGNGSAAAEAGAKAQKKPAAPAAAGKGTKPAVK